MKNYRVVSLFSGCGGADFGMLGGFYYNKKKYSKLPFSCIFANDIDQKALNTFQLNIPAKKILCKDICQVDVSDIPDHDVLVGGFPCQSFSTVNPTKDPFDERANLYKQMIRIAASKKPKIIIAENVKGLLTLHGGKILKTICKAFNDIGYKVQYRLFNAADFGVPQKRQRLIIICVRSDIKEEFTFPLPPNENNWVPLSTVIKKLDIEEKKYYFSQKAVQGMRNAKNNMKRGLAQDLAQPSLTLTSHLAKVSLNSRDPVLLVNPSKDLYRRFTPREAASIQSFPDTFQFAGTETDAYRQIGNAIAPVFFWYIAKAVANFLNTVPK